MPYNDFDLQIYDNKYLSFTQKGCPMTLILWQTLTVGGIEYKKRLNARTQYTLTGYYQRVFIRVSLLHRFYHTPLFIQFHLFIYFSLIIYIFIYSFIFRYFFLFIYLLFVYFCIFTCLFVYLSIVAYLCLFIFVYL